MTGLEKITAKIDAEAKAEADKIIADAVAECEKINAAYAKRAEEIRNQIESDAEAEAENIISRAKSTAAMARRNVILDAKTQLTEAAFTQAYKELGAMNADRYREMCALLLASALRTRVESEKNLRELEGDEYVEEGGDYEVIFNSRDKTKNADEIIEAARRYAVGKIPGDILANLKVSSQVADIDGGLILKKGGIECNCSFESLFAQLRGKCEGKVLGILFPEDK